MAYPTIEVTAGASLPDIALTWKTSSGSVIPFGLSEPHGFELVVSTPVTFTKTSGIQGSDNAPNVVIAWDSDEVDELPPGRFPGQLWATRIADGKRRDPFPFDLIVKARRRGVTDLARQIVGQSTVTGTDAV